MLIECVNSSPVRFVLINETLTPIRLSPSQIATYSGQFRHHQADNVASREALCEAPAGVAVTEFGQ